MCTCARLATVRSPNAKARPSRNSLKPCFVRDADRHPRERAGELAVGVGVDEVRVQDRRPVPREVAGEPQERERVDVRGAAGSRRAARRAPRARARSPTRPARARAASAGARPSPARGAAAAARAGAPPSRRCRRPSAGGGRGRLIARRPRRSRPPRRSTEWRSATRSRSVAAELGPLARAERRERAQPLGELAGRRRGRTRAAARGRRRARRRRGWTRARAGSPRRPRRRPCRARPARMLFTSTSAPAKQRRHLGAQDGVPEPHRVAELELADEPLELGAVRALRRRQRRPVHVEPHVEPVVERQPQPRA